MAAYMSIGEAHRRINEYLNRFSDAVSYQDGQSLRRILSISSNSVALLSLGDALNTFQEFRNRDSALYVIAYEIRILAERADIELASIGKIPDKSIDAL